MRIGRQIIAFILLIRAMWKYAAVMVDMTNGTQKAIANQANIAQVANTVANMRALGLPSPGTPGGAPSVYTPSYESQLSSCLQSLINNLHSGGIL